MKKMRTLIAAAVVTGGLLFLPLLPAGAATPQAARPAVVPAAGHRVTVHPRVSCQDGTGRTAGFDGEIGWGGVGSTASPAYIDVDGRLWSSCKGSAYLYISYHSLGNSYNKMIKSVGAGKNVGVNWSTEGHWAPFSNIAIDVCTRSNGWRCGPPVHV